MEKIEQRFSAGGIQATVYKTTKEIDGKKIPHRTVSFIKRYKSKDGEWKTSPTLADRDLPNAMVVLAKAYEYIKIKCSEETQ